MFKNLYIVILLFAGLMVGIWSSTVAPDADLSVKKNPDGQIEQTYTPQVTPEDMQRNNQPSDRVA
ncbi:MAG TPA: hypothetical protein ACFYD6_01660 [Candidatus Brocadiia bacterium]|nr:hypothetical protein [Candidatus Brocadiales bacterium]